MWHQYGIYEEDASKGIFMQITDMPDNWTKNILLEDPENIGSLADLCGFPKEPVRLGQTATSKTISEAVVAVPFIQDGGERKFFSLPRGDIELALGTQNERLKVDPSIVNMVDAMRKYNFPPPMDFVSLRGVEPFAMYIFEFEHILKRRDLNDIWQNLYPEATERFEEVESTITHPLLKKTLLGGGTYVESLNSPIPDKDEQILGLPDEIRWMVFKVKQKAENNYFKKVLGNDRPLAGMSELPMDISYNWPYDFFSLVELVKIDAEVTFAKGQTDDPRKIKEVYSVEYTRERPPPQPQEAWVDHTKVATEDVSETATSGDTKINEAIEGGKTAAAVGRFNIFEAGIQAREQMEQLDTWVDTAGGVGIGGRYDPSVSGHTGGPMGDTRPNEGEEFIGGSSGYAVDISTSYAGTRFSTGTLSNVATSLAGSTGQASALHSGATQAILSFAALATLFSPAVNVAASATPLVRLYGQ
jgi:hypothetical protein